MYQAATADNTKMKSFQVMILSVFLALLVTTTVARPHRILLADCVAACERSYAKNVQECILSQGATQAATAKCTSLNADILIKRCIAAICNLPSNEASLAAIYRAGRAAAVEADSAKGR
jgi:hypothetical protein